MNRTPRQELWIALSDLFLDTYPELFYDDIIKTVAETGFTDEQVKHILLTEVEPALRCNLQSPIGVWEGFDEQWVIERIEEVKKTPPSWWANLRSWSKYAENHWEAIVRRRAMPNQ